MRKFVLGMIGAVAFSTAANAQSANWSGPSIGASGGYGWGNASQVTSPIPPPPIFITDHSYSLDGGMIGGGIGYDFQTGPWVLGLLADYSWANLRGGTTATTCGPLECGAELRSFGTVRGRLGYATGIWLPYVTGGFAFGDVWAFNNNIGVSGSNMHTGWTAGGGIEAMFAPNWSAKIEYLYADLGSSTPYQLAPGVPESVSVTANILRVGVNYRFNAPPAPAPLVRKY